MSISVKCQNCGLQVTVPDKYGRPKKVRCPDCDAVCELGPAPGTPAEKPATVPVEETRPKPAPKKGPAKPAAAPDDDRIVAAPPQKASAKREPVKKVDTAVSPAVPDSRIHGTLADDDQPYPVPADPEQKEPCPHCNTYLPLGTVVCNHCGFDRQAGTILQRTYEKVNKEWEAGLPLRTRFSIFVPLVSITLVSAIAFGVTEGDLQGLLITWTFGTPLLAFLLGTFPRLILTRNKKGQVRLTKIWRICFIPWQPTDIRLREYEGISVRQFHKSDVADFGLLIFLLLMGVIPGILWWIFVMSPVQFDVALTRDHGTPALLLYRGRSETTAKEIAVSIRNVTDLK